MGVQFYYTLQEAIDAAADGATVELLTDVCLDDKVKAKEAGITIKKSLTLDGNGHKIYNTQEVESANPLVQIGRTDNTEGNSYADALSALITLKDLTIENTGDINCTNAPLINIWGIDNRTGSVEAPVGAVTFENVIIKSAKTGSNFRGISTSNHDNAVITLRNVNLSISDKYAMNMYDNESTYLYIYDSTIEGWSAINNWTPGLTVVAENSTFNSFNSHDGESDDFACVIVSQDDKDDKVSRADMTFVNCELIADVTVDNPGNVSQHIFSIRNANTNSTITLDDNCSLKYRAVNSSREFDIEQPCLVTVGGVYFANGNNLQYTIDNAPAGSTIKLIDDVDLDFSGVAAETPAVKIEKSLTIEGNGHSLKNTKAITNNKVQLLTVKGLKEGDKVEIKDLTLKSDTYSTGLRGLQIDTCTNAEVVLDNVNINLPHYYAVYITTGCEGTKLTINKGSYKAWGAVYNHSSKFTLNASGSTFEGVNVCERGGVDNSFSTIIVSEYWSTTENSSDNLMTFDSCTFSASKTYPDSNVKQTVVKMRSPVRNTVKFTSCTFSPVTGNAPIWSCSNDIYNSKNIPTTDQNTNEVYIGGVKQDNTSNDVFWYLRNTEETETNYYAAN